MKLHEIPTPALVVDVNAMERNIRRMADFFADGACKIRPHFKAHKTPAVASRQLAARWVSPRPAQVRSSSRP
jgi:D-serine deaminase-like pyridoxal phosphate-dependent protein